MIVDSVSADHPVARDHFPHDHVVPGVVLLHRIERAVHAAEPKAAIIGLASLRFSAPARFGEDLQIALNRKSDDRMQVKVRQNDAVILSGTLRLSVGGNDKATGQ
jgi:3-hydroxymyristoyl/3-hydroxydecanoyl-(acyl carrier protein) dehydratase